MDLSHLANWLPELNQQITNLSTFQDLVTFQDHYYSKISNTSCLPKKPRQTAQTQIRLLLKKQSDQGLPCLLFWQAFCEFQLSQKTNIFFANRKRKVFNIFRTFTVLSQRSISLQGHSHVICFISCTYILVIDKKLYEPRHVISNNKVFWQM